MPTIFVVEDNILLASTLTRFLRDHGSLTIAGVAQTAEEAIKQLGNLSVDLVLVDVALPGMNGIDLISTLKKHYPEIPCLILSGHNESDYVRRALEAGASGYVLKSEPTAILAALQKVLAGETYISEELQKKLYH